jgi:8-oxo-dGTP diphosphatase
MVRTLRQQIFHAYTPTPSAATHEQRFCQQCGSPCADIVVGGRPRPACTQCGHVHYRNPAPGVAVVVRQGDQVLLGRRPPTAAFGGRWALPAGFIEFDEDFLTAARRETREETGLEVAVTAILNVTFNYLSERLHALVVAVAARPIGGRLAAGDDICDVRWLPIGGRLPPLAYEADATLLRQLARGDRQRLPVDRRYAQPRRAEEVHR